MADGPSTAQDDSRQSTEPARARVFAPIASFIEDVATVRDLLDRPKVELSQESTQQLQSLLRHYRNCCGQYAIAATLQAYGTDISIDTVIRDTNRSGIFTTALEISKYLEQHGVSAPIRNRGSLDQLEQHLRTGNTAILLVNAQEDGPLPAPHWIAVGGSRVDCAGERQWTISDAAFVARSEDGIGELSDAQLEAIWHKPVGVLSGVDLHRHYWIAVGAEQRGLKLPLGTAAVDLASYGVKASIEAPARAIGVSKELLVQFQERRAERAAERARARVLSLEPPSAEELRDVRLPSLLRR